MREHDGGRQVRAGGAEKSDGGGRGEGEKAAGGSRLTKGGEEGHDAVSITRVRSRSVMAYAIWFFCTLD